MLHGIALYSSGLVAVKRLRLFQKNALFFVAVYHSHTVVFGLELLHKLLGTMHWAGPVISWCLWVAGYVCQTTPLRCHITRGGEM